MKKYLEKQRKISFAKLVLFNLFVKEKETVAFKFPNKIKGMKFKLELEGGKGRNLTKIGLYETNNGEPVVLKFWPGRRKGYNFECFLNEIRALLVLNKAQERFYSKKSNSKFKIGVPKLIKVVESSDFFFLVLEFKKGIHPISFTAEEKARLIIDIVKFFGNLAKVLKENEKNAFGVRNPLDLVWLYPLLLARAVTVNPYHVKELIIASRIFVKALLTSWKGFELTLVHRDLHFRNLLIYKNEVTILDFQYMVLSDQLLDLANLYKYDTHSSELLTYLEELAPSCFPASRNISLLLQGLAVFSLTHGLIESSNSRAKRGVLIKRLEKINQLNARVSGFRRIKYNKVYE